MVKQMLANSYHCILFNNKKEQTIDMCDTFDESLENYVKWEKAHPKWIHTILFQLYNTLKRKDFRNR